jgi:hypothetical protein
MLDPRGDLSPIADQFRPLDDLPQLFFGRFPLQFGEPDRVFDPCDGGAEIVKYLKTGSAYYAPSAGAVEMVDAIVHDRKRILPCAAWLEGEYGMSGLYLGVPCKLGRRGLERVLEIELTADERAALERSAQAVREPMSVLSL